MRPRELIKAWVEAFNQHDAERMAAFYSKDATNYQVPELPITGRDAIRAMFKDAFGLAEMCAFRKTSLKMANGAFSNGAILSACADAGSFTLLMGKLCSNAATGTS